MISSIQFRGAGLKSAQLEITIALDSRLKKNATQPYTCGHISWFVDYADNLIIKLHMAIDFGKENLQESNHMLYLVECEMLHFTIDVNVIQFILYVLYIVD